MIHWIDDDLEDEFLSVAHREYQEGHSDGFFRGVTATISAITLIGIVGAALYAVIG